MERKRDKSCQNIGVTKTVRENGRKFISVPPSLSSQIWPSYQIWCTNVVSSTHEPLKIVKRGFWLKTPARVPELLMNQNQNNYPINTGSMQIWNLLALCDHKCDPPHRAYCHNTQPWGRQKQKHCFLFNFR